MYTPLSRVREYEPPKPVLSAPIPARLEPVDYRILTYLFRGWKTLRIATKLKRPVSEVAARIDRHVFRRLQADVEGGVVRGIITAATTEPATIAKAAAPAAMRQIVKLSATCQDPRTRLHAAKSVLTYAGVEPPARIEVTTPERILDQMTAEELARFAAHKVWPERFRDLLRAFLPAPTQPAPGETIIEARVIRADDEPVDEDQVGSATAYPPEEPPSG
jgi:hypothetical protein